MLAVFVLGLTVLDRGQFAIRLHEVRLQIWHKNRPGGDFALIFQIESPVFFLQDMVVLAVTSVQLLFNSSRSSEAGFFFTNGPMDRDGPRITGPQDNQCNLITLTKHLKKMAMLDVLVLGIIVVVLSGSVYKEQGRKKPGQRKKLNTSYFKG